MIKTVKRIKWDKGTKCNWGVGEVAVGGDSSKVPRLHWSRDRMGVKVPAT